jgi:hypothetical protein
MVKRGFKCSSYANEIYNKIKVKLRILYNEYNDFLINLYSRKELLGIRENFLVLELISRKNIE